MFSKKKGKKRNEGKREARKGKESGSIYQLVSFFPFFLLDPLLLAATATVSSSRRDVVVVVVAPFKADE